MPTEPCKYQVGDLLIFQQVEDWDSDEPEERWADEDILDKAVSGETFLVLFVHDPPPGKGIAWYTLLRVKTNEKENIDWLRVEILLRPV